MVLSTLFLLGLIFSVGFPVYAYRNLPPLDFRAYAPGMNIKENMKRDSSFREAKYETRFLYKNLKNGEVKEFDMKNYPWQDTLNWAHDSTLNVLIHDAVNAPKITDFTVNSLDGNSITDSLLNDKNYSFWIIMYDIKKSKDDETLIAKMKDFNKLATGEKHEFIVLTSSGPQDIEAYKKKHNVNFEFASADGIVLKTMIRSNPGLMLVKDGTVIQNWHHHNFPSYNDVKQKYMK